MRDYWGNRYDLKNYDEDGFAIGLPADHPGRTAMSVIQGLSGDIPEVKIYKDYTMEFESLHFQEKWYQVTNIEVRTNDPSLTHGDVEFIGRCMIKGQPYQWKYTIARMERREQESWNRATSILFMQLARIITRQVQELCNHHWKALNPIVAQCELCGMKRGNVTFPIIS